MKTEVWTLTYRHNLNAISSIWKRGTQTVDFTWMDGSAGEVFRVVWFEGGILHRDDGPADALGFATISDAFALSRLDSPEMIDAWLREHVSKLTWFIAGCAIHERDGNLTEQFPAITRELICINIAASPNRHYITLWLAIARSFGLMDDGLRQLEQSVLLL